MKIALYISEGIEQIVLTPQSNTEKSLLEKMHKPEERTMTVHRGCFYACQGGWVRQGTDDDSTIIVLEAKPR